MKLPEKVIKTIKSITEQRQIEEKTLVEEFEQIYNAPNAKKYPEELRHEHARKLLYVRHMSEQPSKEFPIVIPFGLSEKRTTRAGNIRSSIYVLIQGSGGSSVKEIVCRDNLADIVNHIELFKAYKKVHLADKGFLEAASTTKFSNPSKINIDEMDFLTKYCKLPRVPQLVEMPRHISKLNEAGFVESMDIKIASGIVVRHNKGQRKDGSKFAVYNIKDESLGLEDEIVTARNGNAILPSTITIWTPPQLAIYDIESELAFVGPIQIGRNDKNIFMNAYTVIPDGIVREITTESKR